MQRTELLNDDQKFALGAMIVWYNDPSPASPFFLLEGGAGTGKTFLVRAFVDQIKGRGVFTAPTNKATKVLRQSLTDDEFKPVCSTVFSLLGLRLEANGEVKELTSSEEDIDLTGMKYVVVDEGSMVSSVLWKELKKAQQAFKFRVIVMGDDKQLPPVKESTSPVWKLREGESWSELKKQMRFDNQILSFATNLRRLIEHPAPRFSIINDNDGTEGIWSLTLGEMESRIREAARLGRFSRPDDAKAIAWRNVTVDRLNSLIRKELFTGQAPKFVESDRVIFTSPAKDLDDKPMVSTDDEGRIDRALVDRHPIYTEFEAWRLSITLDTNKTVVAWALHESAEAKFNRRVEELAAEAKRDGRKWKFFWDFKDAFHGVRHGYALTAHRSQGSTYQAAFVDWRDILRNPVRSEGMRCLYVACTRPKKELYLG